MTGHADAFQGRLLNAVHHGRRRDVSGLEDGRRDIDDVVELVTCLAFARNAFRPVHDRSVARATQWEATCLVH